ncbi:MAG: PH domain-containing protein [Lachnospiraceae bacterium]
MFKEKKRTAFGGFPFSFTWYIIEDENLKVKTGFISQKEENCYMYKVIDVTLRRGLLERIFNLGTVECSTGDATTAIIKLKHIRNFDAVKEFLLEKSEIHRIKRRTINTIDLDTNLD